MDSLLIYILLGINFSLSVLALYVATSKKPNTIVSSSPVATSPSSLPRTRVRAELPPPTPKPLIDEKPVDESVVPTPTPTESSQPFLLPSTDTNLWTLKLRGTGFYSFVVEWSDGTKDVFSGVGSRDLSLIRSKSVHPEHIRGIPPHHTSTTQIEWDLNGFHWST